MISPHWDGSGTWKPYIVEGHDLPHFDGLVQESRNSSALAIE